MPERSDPTGYYYALTARSLMAGWARREQPTGSKSEMHVPVWRADAARAALQKATRFVGTDVAERRNLILVNVPFVRHIEAMFFEYHPEAFQRPVEGDPAFRIPLLTHG
jgi:hypothetical protein